MAPSPLCGHCGLPVGGAFHLPEGPLYCCSGCALAHRILGGPSEHERATGLLMSAGIGAFLAMNVMMLSFVLDSGRGDAVRAAGERWVRWTLLALASPAIALLGLPFLTRGVRRLRDRVLDTDALVVLGVGAVFTLSVRSMVSGGGPIYLDTAMGTLLLVTLGRYLEAAARARTEGTGWTGLTPPTSLTSPTSLTPLVDRLSAFFVPGVVLLALGTLLYWSLRASFGTGLMSSLSVLLIACPGAIEVAILSRTRLSLFWALFYNGLGLPLAAAGLLHPLFSALAMVASSLLVVLRSQRLTRYPLPAGEGS